MPPHPFGARYLTSMVKNVRAGAWSLVAGALIVVAALAGWWIWRPDPDRTARAAFRDEVIGVIGARFARGAVAVPSDPSTIQIAAARRDIGSLYNAAARLPERERRQKIYLWFLGDPETASRVVVREEPFETPAAPPQPPSTKPHLDGIAPKTVKTMSVRPDGSIGSSQSR